MGQVTLEEIDKLLKDNLKKELKTTEANLKKEIKEFKKGIFSEIEQLKKENSKLKNRVEKLASRKVLIMRGIPENEESKKDEIENLSGIFVNMGCDTIDIENAVVYAGRVGKMHGKRLLKIECNTLKDCQRIRSWWEELKQKGISISKDYTFEERQEYAALKEIQNALKRKLAITTKITGNKIEIYQKRYDLEGAQKCANELLAKEGMEVLSSPEAIVDGKRTKIIQRQKGEDKKTKKHNEQRKSPKSKMDVEGQENQDSSD